MRGALAAWGRLELATPPGFAERVMAAVELEPAPGSPKPLRPGRRRRARRSSTTRSGRIPLPGGRTIPVKNLIGWGLATAAVVIGFERRHGRRSRELTPL